MKMTTPTLHLDARGVVVLEIVSKQTTSSSHLHAREVVVVGGMLQE